MGARDHDASVTASAGAPETGIPAEISAAVAVEAMLAHLPRDPDGYADPAAWADIVMSSRPPDFVIGDDYLWRWWIVPRNRTANVYLHRIMHSDDDRALHDHPWDNISVLLKGRYIEHTPDGAFERVAGSVVTRKATDAHRLEVLPGEEAISLFITGTAVREWGLHCPQGWRHWREFVDSRDAGQVGRGCA